MTVAWQKLPLLQKLLWTFQANRGPISLQQIRAMSCDLLTPAHARLTKLVYSLRQIPLLSTL
jgi:hypothetical protein